MIKKCNAITRNGDQCKNSALPETEYCTKHTDPETVLLIQEKTIGIICNVIKEGLICNETACSIAGISKRALTYWLKNDKALELKYNNSIAIRNSNIQTALLQRAGNILSGENRTSIDNKELWIIRATLHKIGMKDPSWIAEKNKRKSRVAV